MHGNASISLCRATLEPVNFFRSLVNSPLSIGKTEAHGTPGNAVSHLLLERFAPADRFARYRVELQDSANKSPSAASGTLYLRTTTEQILRMGTRTNARCGFSAARRVERVRRRALKNGDKTLLRPLIEPGRWLGYFTGFEEV